MQLYKNVFDYSSNTIDPSIDDGLFVANSKGHHNNNDYYTPPVGYSSGYSTDARAVSGYGGFPGRGSDEGSGRRSGKVMPGGPPHKDKSEDKFKSKSDYHKSTTYERHYRRRKREKVKEIPPRVSCELNIAGMYSPNIVVFSMNIDVYSGTFMHFRPELVALIDYGDGSRQVVYPNQYRTLYIGYQYSSEGKYNIKVYLHTQYSDVKSKCSISVDFRKKFLPKGIVGLLGEGHLTVKKSSFIKGNSTEIILNDPVEVLLTDDAKEIFLVKNPFITLSREKNG